VSPVGSHVGRSRIIAHYGNQARRCRTILNQVVRVTKATFETCGVELVRVFKTPTTPGGMMGHWLRWLIEHEEQQSPK